MKKIEKEILTFIENQNDEIISKTVKKIELEKKKSRYSKFSLVSNKKTFYNSVESQTGTALQKIAFFLARKKFEENNVPNIIVLSYSNSCLKMSAYSFPFEDGITQKVFLNNGIDEVLTKKQKNSLQKGLCYQTIFKFDCTEQEFDKISKVFRDRDEMKIRKRKKPFSIPIDLFYFQEEGNRFSSNCFEIKKSGILDTKNADSNAREVLSLKQLFSFSNVTANSYFAICENIEGNDVTPYTISQKISRENIF